MSYMIGMNLGNDTNGSRTSYPSAENAADLDYLKSLGVTKLRIKLEYHLDSVGVGYTKQLALDAKAKGFTVIWGVTAGTSDTAANYNTWKTTSVTNAAQWASQNGIDLFLIGNEEDASVANGGFTGVTKPQVQADVRSLATSIKQSYPAMQVGYTISDQTIDDWNGNTGVLDRLGANIYGSLSVFQDNISRFTSTSYSFGSKFFVSEWNVDGGYPGTGNTTDTAYINDLAARRATLANHNLEAYFYTWKDGGDDGWAIRHTDNTFRPGIGTLFPDTYHMPITLSSWYANGYQPALSVSTMQTYARAIYDHAVSQNFTQTGMPANMGAGAWRVKVPDQTMYLQKGPNGTVSEGMGYGMLLTAFYGNSNLPAGVYDSTAKSKFDGLYTYAKYYFDSNGLMNWDINYDGTLANGGGATDADFDIAMALVIAHRQWGSTGAINYAQEATNMITAIRDHEFYPANHATAANLMINGDGWDANFTGQPDRYMHDYLRVGWMREFYYHTGDTRWTDLIAANKPAYQYFYDNYTGGIVPDGTTRSWGNNNSDAYTGGYNACRIGIGLATDYLWHGSNAEPLYQNFITRTATKALATYGTGDKVQAPSWDLNGNGGGGYFNFTGAQMFGIASLMSSTTQTFGAQILTAMYNNISNENSYFGNMLGAVGTMIMAGIAQPGTTDTTYAPPATQQVTSYVATWTSSSDVATDFTSVTAGSNTVTVPSASNGNPGNAVAVTTTATSDEGDVKKELSGNTTVYFDFKLPTGATVSSTSDYTIFHAWDGTPTAYGNDLVEIRFKGSGAGYIFELVDPAASYATTAGTTVLSLGTWQSLKLVISSTDIKLYLNGNGSTPEITYTKTYTGKTFGPMVWGKFYGTAYIGTMYFDNFSVGSVTTHTVVVAGPNAQQSGKLSVKQTGVTNTQSGVVRVQAPGSATQKQQSGVVRVQAGTTSGGSAATRTNLVLNPSGEGTQGYSTYISAGQPTIALDNTTALYGAQSYSIDSKGINTDAGFLLQTAPIVNSTQYTLSYYVKTTGTVANASVTVRNGAPTTTSSTSNSPTSWTRKSITFTASGTTLEIVVGLGSYGSQSQGKVNFDGFLLEAAATAGSYFDGATAGGVWTGTANDSTSTLSSTGGTISGKLRVLLNGKYLQTGVVKVIRANSVTQPGIVRVAPTGTKKTVDGVIRIKSTSPSVLLNGKLQVMTPAAKAVAGVIRVLQPHTNVQGGVLRVKNTPTATLAGLVRIFSAGAPTERTTTGVVNIKNGTSRTFTGKLAVRQTNSATQSGLLRLTPSGLKQNIIAGMLKVGPADYSVNQFVSVEFTQDATITVEYGKTIL